MRNAATNRLITSGLCVLFRHSSAAGDERREESTRENPRPVQIVQVGQEQRARENDDGADAGCSGSIASSGRPVSLSCGHGQPALIELPGQILTGIDHRTGELFLYHCAFSHARTPLFGSATATSMSRAFASVVE